MASPTPVLPLVGSTIVPPGWSSPSRSAARIISSAGRSFDEPPGLVVSIFMASTLGMCSTSLIRRSRTSGVLPMRSTTDGAIAVPARRGSSPIPELYADERPSDSLRHGCPRSERPGPTASAGSARTSMNSVRVPSCPGTRRALVAVGPRRSERCDTPSVVSVDVAWSIEQVVAIAPTPARFAAADAIAAPSRWVAVGADEQAVWGRCRGSGREPYETMVDHAHLAWRCTCPSRSHPCKHALALLIMWVKGQVPAAPAPAGVRSWVDGHARREAAGGGSGTGAAAPAPPPTSSTTPSRCPTARPTSSVERDERIARLLGGLVELDRWLDDRLRTGLADPALARYATWDDLAARLVDARAGALANRVRRLAGVVGARPDWHEVVLAELGVLHLLAEAGQRVPELPGGLADAVATSCGWQVRQADVLAGVPDTDTWVVAGRSDTREDRIEVRRTWLRGAGVGALGDGAVVRRLPPVARHLARRRRCVHGRPPPLPGTVVAGPDRRPARGRRHASGRAAGHRRRRRVRRGRARPSPPSRGSTASRRPCVATPAFAGGRWVLTDDGGALALAPDAPGRADAAGRLGRSPGHRHGGVDDRRLRPAHRPPARSGPRRRAARRPLVRERGMSTSLTDHWHELVTVALLGTDRRDPPDPPTGPLADVVDDTVAATAVGADAGRGRPGAWRRAAPACARSPRPCRRWRPTTTAGRCVTPAAARRWWSLIRTWPVLEDEWLAVVERSGRRLPPDVLVGLLRRHRTDGTRLAVVRRLGGAVVDVAARAPAGPALVDHAAAPAGGRRSAARPGRPAGPARRCSTPVRTWSSPAVVGGFRRRRVRRRPPRRARQLRRPRPHRHPARRSPAPSPPPSCRTRSAGLAASLAELAATRHHMLEELAP